MRSVWNVEGGCYDARMDTVPNEMTFTNCPLGLARLSTPQPNSCHSGQYFSSTQSWDQIKTFFSPKPLSPRQAFPRPTSQVFPSRDPSCIQPGLTILFCTLYQHGQPAFTNRSFPGPPEECPFQGLTSSSYAQRTQ